MLAAIIWALVFGISWQLHNFAARIGQAGSSSVILLLINLMGVAANLFGIGFPLYVMFSVGVGYGFGLLGIFLASRVITNVAIIRLQAFNLAFAALVFTPLSVIGLVSTLR